MQFPSSGLHERHKLVIKIKSIVNVLKQNGYLVKEKKIAHKKTEIKISKTKKSKTLKLNKKKKNSLHELTKSKN